MTFDEIDWKRTLQSPRFWIMICSVAAVLIAAIVIVVNLFSDDADSSQTALQDAAQNDAFSNSFADNAISCNSTVIVNQTAVDELTSQIDALKRSVDDCIAAAVKDKNQSKVLIKSLGNDVAEANAELKSCKQQLTTVNEQNATIADAARRLCCMQRVNDPTIDSYDIVDSKIACSNDAKNSIKC